MSPLQFQFHGKSALAALAAIALLTGARLATFRDLSGDADLMRDLQHRIPASSLPDAVDRLRAAAESGDREQIAQAAHAVSTPPPRIVSVKMSAPLLSLASHQEVVVQVVFEPSTPPAPPARQTAYYLYGRGALGSSWTFRRSVTALTYFLNFT